MPVLAALSGGVDSAVAAALLVEAGERVVGVHLALGGGESGGRGCCTVEDAGDARRAADVLGIPFYVWDFAAEFRASVVDDFVAEYSAGRTPNPCLRCNESVKFAAVLDRALALGFDAVATGHYARILDTPSGPELHRAADQAKDQSYVLGVLEREQLSRAIFPLGEWRKEEVRAAAAERDLPVADKPDSTDLCFVPEGDTAGWLAERLGPRPGRILDEEGVVLGRHEGGYRFTIGQRRGLRLTQPAADGRPRYVLRIDPVSRDVVVGPRAALDVTQLIAAHPRWCTDPPRRPTPLLAQVRAHGAAHPASAWVEEGDIVVRFEAPVGGVAPGQTVVLYDGSRVVGSGTVRGTVAAVEPRHRLDEASAASR